MRLIFFTIFNFISCSNETAINKELSASDTAGNIVKEKIENNRLVDNTKTEFKIESIKNIPSAIDGCSGLFKKDNADTAFVFAMNFGEDAFIQLNGKLINLKLLEKNNSENSFDQRYSGDGIEVRLKAREVKRIGYELSKYEGTISVQYQNHSKEISITGEVGC